MNEAIEILLVEDSDEDAELTMRALGRSRKASKVHRVVDGAEALDFLFCEGQYEGRKSLDPPRVVLLDLKLPRVDGLEVLRRVKETPATHSLPIVIMTSSKEDRDLEHAYRLGVNSYVVKPVEFDDFMRTVQAFGTYWLDVNETRR